MRANIPHGADAPTHYQVLLAELAAHGRVTYAELMESHPGYDYHGFTQAARRVRGAGLARSAPGANRRTSEIEACGVCPCCGRALCAS